MATLSPSSQPKIWLTILHLLFFFSPSLSYQVVHTAPSFDSLSYTKHCNSIVPQSAPRGFSFSKLVFPQMGTGYFTGGDKFLSQNLNLSTNSPKSLVFRTFSVYRTDVDDILMVEATLIFRVRNPVSNYTLNGKSKRFSIQTHRRRRAGLTFHLNGFWSESSGKLCMVGPSTGYSTQGTFYELSAVFTLNYPQNSTILTSLVSGSLESVETADNVNYFEPISVMFYSHRNYDFTLISKVNESEFSEGGGVSKNLLLSLEQGRSICSELHSSSVYDLEYGSDCIVTKNCNPLGSSVGVLPSMIIFTGAQCFENERLTLMIGISNNSYSVYSEPLLFGKTLVGEGVWDVHSNRLHIVACRILNYTGSSGNASVGDCSFRLSIGFPAVMSMKSRSRVVGQIWSNKTVNESGYFDKVVFQSPRNLFSVVPGLKYEYTQTDRVVKSCPKKTAKTKGLRYPSEFSRDMSFNLEITSRRGKHVSGHAIPLSVGDEFYDRPLKIVSTSMAPRASIQTYENVMKNEKHGSLLNVSYSFLFRPYYNAGGAVPSTNVFLDLNVPIDISAEGIYNTETGNLCMVGCRYIKSLSNRSTDCEILINLQFRPLDSKSSEYVTGTLQSMREKFDPLHFEKLQLVAISWTSRNAADFVQRMDLEITMVLISNTLLCIFVGLQIYYVKKHPDVLPSISLLMLVILTLGQMIPLVLNFEALFLRNRNRQNVMTGSGGWLEVNEVLVRVITMVSFLLQCRLLQLTWSSRSDDGTQKGLVLVEKKSVLLLLPLYLVGAFVAWGMHWWNNSHGVRRFAHGNIAEHSLWGDLRSYAGLLLDGFLIPQIMFNVFSNSKGKGLYPAFYVGITFLHLLPHAYDLYRAHRYVTYASYIYANPGGDFFSTAWDVIIPCGGLLFAILIYLQQRFGGCCFIPPRFRQSSAYEKVPVASGE